MRRIAPTDESEIHYGEGRKLVWTKTGALGLVPVHALLDDVLFIPEGGRMPIVIRHKNDNHYTFIGAAYVHGLMHGEAWTMEASREKSDIVLI